MRGAGCALIWDADGRGGQGVLVDEQAAQGANPDRVAPTSKGSAPAVRLQYQILASVKFKSELVGL